MKKRRKIYIVLCLVLIGLSGCGKADKAIVWSEEIALSEEAPVSVEGPVSQPETAFGEKDADSEEKGSLPMICVFVCGQVASPGVVSLPAGSRLQDALDAAGGFAPDADRNAVNLAAVAQDGQRIYFPSEEETAAEPQIWNADSTSAAQQTTGGELVDINHADLSSLCTLPGIGEARAQAIIRYREENGRFQKTEDIMKVSGIKQAAFDKIKDKITVK